MIFPRISPLSICRYACVLLVLFFSYSLHAAIDEYVFESDEDREQFRKLTAELRCPKCLNTNLSGSDAPIAVDLRAEIYEQIQEGHSNEEIVEFFRVRYGDFITYKPPLNSSTVFLWFGPVVLLLAAFIVLRIMVIRNNRAAAGSLSPEEEERLEKLLAEDDKA